MAEHTATPSKPAWLKFVDEYLGLEEEGSQVRPINESFDSILASMVKEYLLCDDADAAAIFARRFDDLYGAVYEPRFNGYRKRKKGWTGFLITFYEMLLGVAVEVRYDDPKQDKVVQLLVELRKLPARVVKIFVQPEFEWVDSEIWTRDPLFPWELFTLEPYGVPDMTCYNWDDPEEVQQYESDTANWLDFYTFQARCTAAGLDEGHKYRFNPTGTVMSVGLEQGYPSNVETKLDIHVMAAAQHILIAGDVVDAECVKKQLPTGRNRSWKGWRDGNGPVVWKQWGRRLSEIAEALESGKEPGFKILDEKNKKALQDMVIRARDKMVALEPELFAEPDDPEPEPAPEEGAKPETETEPSRVSNPGPEPSGASGPTQTAGSGPDTAGGSSPPQTLRSMLGFLKQKMTP